MICKVANVHRFILKRSEMKSIDKLLISAESQWNGVCLREMPGGATTIIW